MGLFDALGDIPENKINANAEVLKAYEECHAKLLRDYHSEIIEITKLLNDIRKERIEFCNVILPKMKDEMRKDGAAEESINEWVDIISENMENSFRMSEMIIKSFWVDTKEEFANKLSSQLERV